MPDPAEWADRVPIRSPPLPPLPPPLPCDLLGSERDCEGFARCRWRKGEWRLGVWSQSECTPGERPLAPLPPPPAFPPPAPSECLAKVEMSGRRRFSGALGVGRYDGCLLANESGADSPREEERAACVGRYVDPTKEPHRSRLRPRPPPHTPPDTSLDTTSLGAAGGKRLPRRLQARTERPSPDERLAPRLAEICRDLPRLRETPTSGAPPPPLQFRLRALRLPPARSVPTMAVYAELRHDPRSAAVHAAAHPGTASFCAGGAFVACRFVAWRADAAARGSRRGAGHLLVRRGLLVRKGETGPRGRGRASVVWTASLHGWLRCGCVGGAADGRGAGEEAAPAGGGGEGAVADARGRRAGRRREGGRNRRPRGRAGGIGRGRSCTERLWLWRARHRRSPDSGGGVARRRGCGCAFARGARV